jgi:GAF domain-containing protein
MDDPSLSREDLLRQISALNAENLELRDALLQAKDQSDWMGDAMKARTRVLNERVKELECVFQAVRLLRDPDLGFERKIARIVDLLPKAWLRPELACARATLGALEFRTARYAPPVATLSEPVAAKGLPVGRLEVGYLRAAPPADEGPFLREERELLKIVAECLGAACEAEGPALESRLRPR